MKTSGGFIRRPVSVTAMYHTGTKERAFQLSTWVWDFFSPDQISFGVDNSVRIADMAVTPGEWLVREGGAWRVLPDHLFKELYDEA